MDGWMDKLKQAVMKKNELLVHTTQMTFKGSTSNEKLDIKVYSVQLHFYEIHEQAKLIQGRRNQNSKDLGTNPDSGHQRARLGGERMFHILTCVVGT